jgi:hypothetical protein
LNEEFMQADYRLSALMKNIIQSKPFLSR